MAFPVVESITETIQTSATTHPVDMPATVDADDRLLLIIVSNTATLTASAGLNDWDLIQTYGVFVSDWQFHIYTKLADGDEDGTTVDFTTAGTQRTTAQVYRISGANEAGGTGVAWNFALFPAQGVAQTFGRDPDPPSVTAGWGSDDNLFICGFFAGSTGGTVTTNPANYTAGADGPDTSGQVWIGTAWRQLAASADDPGAFQINGPSGDQENLRMWSLVFRPTQVTGVTVVPVRANARARIEPTSDITLANVPVNVTPVRAGASAQARSVIIPQPPRPTQLEVGFLLNGIWVDAIPTGVLARDSVEVSYGRANWSSRTETSRLTMSLDNRDGRWSPDYADSANAGLWKRNIPVRLGIGGYQFDRYLGRAFVVNGELCSTPDASVLDVAADADFRIEFQLEEDLVEGPGPIFAHKLGVGTGFFWSMLLFPNFSVTPTEYTLRTFFQWRDSAGDLNSVNAILPIEFQHERRALRITMDASTGQLVWYTSTSIDGPWTQLGDPSFTAGATEIASNNIDLRLGGLGTSSRPPFPGKIFAFQMRDGIDGTLVADADFKSQDVGAASFTDSVGRVWSVNEGGRITDMRWRFHGELASIPVRWDTQGRDVWAPIEAAGLFRRLRQGQRPLQSAIRRSIDRNQIGLVQYWPMEEAGDSVTVLGAAVGLAGFVVTNGPAKAASNSEFVASLPLPALAADTWTATVDDYTNSLDRWALRFSLYIPDPGPATANPLIVINTDEFRWELTYDDGPPAELRWSVYNGADVLQTSASATSFGGLDTPLRMQVVASSSGAKVTFQWFSHAQGAADHLTLNSSTLAPDLEPGKVTSIVINPDGDHTDIAIGHVELFFADPDPEDLANQINGHTGEPAGSRIQRLCQEEGISYRVEGDPTDTELMGVQRPKTIMDLLQECADTDLGILHESRDSIAIGYRTRATLIGQTDVIDLDYNEGHVTAPPELDRDDQDFANDITVENDSGATARAVLDDASDLSASEPPVGAGRYDTSYQVNAQDSRLVVLAQARLALSAVDEPRISSLRLSPHFPGLRNNPPLLEQILSASVGDLISVRNNLPVALGTTSIRQLMQGTRDTITNNTHDIRALTSPASPWDDLNVASPVTPDEPDPDPDPIPDPVDGTPAPTIPAFNSGSAITVTSGQNLAAITAANPAGTHFFVENGAICNDVRARASNHYRFAGNFVAEGSGIGYFIRPVDQNASNVVIESDPNALTRAKVRNYGLGTSSQEFGAIMGRVDDALGILGDVSSFIYQDVDGWVISGLEFEANASNAIKLGSNFTVYDCVIYKHSVTGINGDRIVGGLIHSCHLWYNALNPASGVGSNGANIKVTWVNADTGRTSITPVDRTKAQFIVSHCVFDALDQSVSPAAGNSKRGMWFDLDCQDFLVEYCELNDHDNLGIFAEGCNNGRFTQNTVRRTLGFGDGLGANFINGALSTGESTNIEIDNNTLEDCTNALVNRMSNRTSDWLDPSGSANYGYQPGPRYWILDTATIPAVSGQSNIWTGNNNFHDNTLINCTRVVINEGANGGGQTVVGSTDLDTISFSGNDYTQSPSIMFYEVSDTLLSLAAWQALPRTRDNV